MISFDNEYLCQLGMAVTMLDSDTNTVYINSRSEKKKNGTKYQRAEHKV